MDKVPIAIDYVDQSTRRLKKAHIKQTAKYDFKPDKAYHPTHIIGACAVCKTAGFVEFPAGFDFKSGDNIMSRKKVTVFCVTCQKEREFITLKIGNQETQEGVRFLKKIESDKQKTLAG